MSHTHRNLKVGQKVQKGGSCLYGELWTVCNDILASERNVVSLEASEKFQ